MISINSFTFDNKRKEYVKIISRGKPYWSERAIDLIYVTGMNGAYNNGVNVRPLTIPVTIRVEANGPNELQERAEEIAEWLLHEEVKELKFDNMPNRTYFALVSGTVDVDEIVAFSTVSFDFICLEPYKFGDELTASFPSDSVSVVNGGNEETEPLFILQANRSDTMVMVRNHLNEYVIIGEPLEATQQPFERFKRVFTSRANNLVGWTQADSTEIDGGVVEGLMIALNGRYQASSLGSGTGWHGPAMKTSLPEPIYNFRLNARVTFDNTERANRVGRVEIYLLDELGNAVGKMSMKDVNVQEMLNHGEARAGNREDNHFLINEHGTVRGVWNDFNNGIFRIMREGTKWTAYFAEVNKNTGLEYGRRTRTWFDTAGEFTNNVAQILIHFGTLRNYSIPEHGIHEITIDEIQDEPEGVPYIFHQGDRIMIDNKNGLAYINGEPIPVNFGSDFFTIKKGLNNIFINPMNSFDTEMIYREKFK